MKTRIFICFGLLIGMLGCESGVVINQNLKIENAAWEREKTARFEFEVEDTLSSYSLFLNFRHGGNYPYQNLYLFTETAGPRGLIAKDTAQMILANARGRWLGKGIGDIFDYQFEYKKGKLFPRKGKYSIEIEQAMYDKVLHHVTDIGIKVKQNEN